MKIASLNIDWALQTSKEKIAQFLNAQNFDFLILNEAIDLSIRNFPYKYFSDQIPDNTDYEGLNYSKYLKGEKAFRTMIYSKIPAKRKFSVIDEKTSLALEFETKFGDFIIYATIIGTRFRLKPFAKNELENCINDCKKISETNPNLIIVGDLNTSFLDNERQFSINIETTESLKSLFNDLNLINATENITQNIDHIIIPNFLTKNLTDANIFLEKDMLSDHKGVFISFN
ncbi:endonuclease/exonuclease/phosphatase family protein [Epilithonimonas ginsengisoli]|uniref:Endonuclease/exonuclease/phosphatase family protein n=1 Tax=Epilithonimonas ginsengisoli TaxID=1245592 RepID=A0ABU4JEH5_9FLAO|nr:MULTISPECIES: endonuclease/exonuclease/phosphatase family protein [Chryseobacterium group]MBV6879441.1 endonuclease/exonuclease/phosphatase family protein [Epilithonimonas sp. FP105]MDW8548077.1 endonuclease/exonuclease/phosphatase family protein [Epilithonimonas ginsengisoli]OAH64482.1 hypothetical protein AXA65_19185 [Chryseobacterium sp. FP211-J200]